MLVGIAIQFQGPLDLRHERLYIPDRLTRMLLLSYEALAVR